MASSAIFGTKKVSILDDSATSALVRVEDEHGNEFSIARNKLRFPPPLGSEPTYVSSAVPAAMQGFVQYLQGTIYSLFVICRTDDQVQRAQEEYASWTNGESMPQNTIRTYFDDSGFDACWCLDFSYSSSIDYPFAILERGTGDRKRSSTGPVAWHKNGRIESRYAETAELVVRGGLRAFKA